MSKDYFDAQGRFHPDPFTPERAAMRELEDAEAQASDKCVDLRRRAEKAERELDDLLAALEDLADFVEDNYRKAMPFTDRRELDRQVAEHALLKPARAAIARAKGEKP